MANVFCSIVAFFLGGIVAQDPTVDELEQMVLRERRGITACDIHLKATTHKGDGSPRIRDYAFTLDPTGQLIYRQTAGVETEFTATVALTADGHIDFDNQQSPRGTYRAATIHEKPLAPDAFKTMALVVDPRLIGMVPYPFETLRNFHLESHIGNNDRTTPVVERTEWNSRPAWRISFNYLPSKSNRPYEIIVDPEYRSVVSMRSAWTDKGAAWERTLTSSDFHQYGPDQTWFPSKCTHKETRDGVVQEEQSLEIDVRSVNDPLDPQVFAFANLGIPDGAPVYKEGDTTERFRWTDGQLVAEEMKLLQGTVTAPELSPRQPRSWLWVSIAGACALVAIIAAFLYFRRSKAPD